MKKILGLILSVTLLLTTMSSVAFADTNKQIDQVQETAKKAGLQKKLDAITQKYGGQAIILDNADPSKTYLNFDTVEDFEKAIGSFRIEPSKTLRLDTQESSLLSTSGFTATFNGDHAVMLGAIQLGTIRQRLTATEYWSGTANLFSSVTSQTSYPINWNFMVSWAETSASSQIIDGGRTVAGTIYGRCTLGVAIEGFPIGYTKEATLFDEFYAV